METESPNLYKMYTKKQSVDKTNKTKIGANQADKKMEKTPPNK